MMRSGNGSLQQVVTHADGNQTSSLLFGNDIGDGVDRSLNVFGEMTVVLTPGLQAAKKRMQEDESNKKIFQMDNADADYEVMIDDTEKPIIYVVTCTKDKVKVARYMRDERRTIDSPMHERELCFENGGLSTTMEEIQEDSLVLFACAVYELRRILRERGQLEQLKKLSNRASGVVVTLSEDGNEIETRIVRGRARPELPCMMFGGLFFRDMDDAVMMRPYVDEMMSGAMILGMSLEEKIEAAENGDPDVMEHLALQYLNGDDEVKQNFERAAYWWQKLADTDSALGQFNIGLHYAKGCGVKRDFAKAAEWMRKSAENGDEDAPELVELYGGAAENLKKAEAGDSIAQSEVAKLYMNLGRSLEQFGAQHDYDDAFKWSKKAADQGNLDGMYYLGLCYEHGRGTPVAEAKAALSYEKAANRGHAPSQWNLAVCYLNGCGYERNELKGYMWAYKSADQGYELAINALTQHEKTIEQIIEAYQNPKMSITLEGTQYESRAERCERLRSGTVLTYRITKDKDNDEIIDRPLTNPVMQKQRRGICMETERGKKLPAS